MRIKRRHGGSWSVLVGYRMVKNPDPAITIPECIKHS